MHSKLFKTKAENLKDKRGLALNVLNSVFWILGKIGYVLYQVFVSENAMFVFKKKSDEQTSQVLKTKINIIMVLHLAFPLEQCRDQFWRLGRLICIQM